MLNENRVCKQLQMGYVQRWISHPLPVRNNLASAMWSAPPDVASASNKGMESSSDFVTKLYQMLDTPEYSGIVRWGEAHDSFVIYDTTLFQELVIPQVFNHSNFSSFVRQLNKYDFHKVRFKNPQSKVWEFTHPEFRPENRDKTHLIRRKPPNKAKSQVSRKAENQLQDEILDLTTRVEQIENTNRQLLNALRLQQSLVERLLNAVDLPEEEDDEKPKVHSRRVLLALDDPGAAEICRKFLEQYGCSVEMVPNGLEVVQRAEANRYHCIVMDIVLSALDGMSATELIRQSDPTTPIIVVADEKSKPSTDVTDPHATWLSSYLRRGASAVLLRPFTKNQLFEALNTITTTEF